MILPTGTHIDAQHGTYSNCTAGASPCNLPFVNSGTSVSQVGYDSPSCDNAVSLSCFDSVAAGSDAETADGDYAGEDALRTSGCVVGTANRDYAGESAFKASCCVV